jgi:hypothetical protein
MRMEASFVTSQAPRPPDTSPKPDDSAFERFFRYAGRMRLPRTLVGVIRMKCAGTPTTHGSSPVPTNGARSASVSR